MTPVKQLNTAVTLNNYTSAKLTSAAPWLRVFFSPFLPGLHVFLERLYFFRTSRVYAGGAGPQGEATAGGLRREEEKPALKEGETRSEAVR